MEVLIPERIRKGKGFKKAEPLLNAALEMDKGGFQKSLEAISNRGKDYWTGVALAAAKINYLATPREAEYDSFVKSLKEALPTSFYPLRPWLIKGVGDVIVPQHILLDYATVQSFMELSARMKKIHQSLGEGKIPRALLPELVSFRRWLGEIGNVSPVFVAQIMASIAQLYPEVAKKMLSAEKVYVVSVAYRKDRLVLEDKSARAKIGAFVHNLTFSKKAHAGWEMIIKEIRKKTKFALHGMEPIEEPGPIQVFPYVASKKTKKAV